MTRKLTIRPDVRRRLRKAGVQYLLESPAVKTVHCYVCGREENLDAGVQIAVSVVVARERGRESVRTQFSHPACAPSRVLPGHPEHESDVVSELVWRAIVRGKIPVLMYGPDTAIMGSKSEDEPLVDLWTDYFRALGFTPLREGDSLPAIAGLIVEIARTEIRIHYPDTDNADRLPIKSDLALDPWLDVIRKTNLVLVVTGPLMDLDHLTDDSFDALLGQGRAVAGVAAVEFID